MQDRDIESIQSLYLFELLKSPLVQCPVADPCWRALRHDMADPPVPYSNYSKPDKRWVQSLELRAVSASALRAPRPLDAREGKGDGDSGFLIAAASA